MAQIVISDLNTGVPQGTDLTPATDTTDISSATTGTTKKYVRSDELNFYLDAQGYTTYSAVTAASTTALTATYSNGTLGVGATLTNAGAQVALTLDTTTLVVGSRVLIKDQAATLQNGIYTVTTLGTTSTNWVLTRATDYNTSALIDQYGLVFVNQGAINGGLLFEELSLTPLVVGTDPITFGTLTPTSSSFNWSTIAGTAQAAEVNNGYVVGDAAQTTITLPLVAAVGNTVLVRGYGTAGWIMSANTGQTIIFGNQTTTTAGSLTSTNQYDSVNVTCIVANLVWMADSVIGSLTIG